MKALPNGCSECRFYSQTNSDKGLCIRHAPGVAREEEEITQWQFVPAWTRCGIGEERGKPVTICERCVHWFQPTGEGLVPRWGKHGKPDAWWERSGFCARYAPSPGGRDSDMTHWRITHADNACGDGQDFEKSDDSKESIA